MLSHSRHVGPNRGAFATYLVVLLSIAAMTGCGNDSSNTGGTAATGGSSGSGGGSGSGGTVIEGPISALVFSKTVGFRHDSIVDAVEWLGNLDPAEEIDIALTEDASVFSDEGLAPFDIVVFVNTTGNVFDESQQGALQRFIRSGKGYAGVHSAADTEHDWPWYEDLVGALFTTHQEASFADGMVVYGGPFEFTVEDGEHPSTSMLDATFMHDDEIYSYGRNPRWYSSILLTVDAAAVGALPHIFGMPPMTEVTDGDHPVAWYKEFEGGRSWYTNIGHEPRTWSLDWFRQHVLEGIRWAARAPNQYNKVAITDQTANPLAMAATPDGDLYYIERTGEIKLWRKETGRVIDAGNVEVSLVGENGLLGIALDPDFAANGELYLYFAEAETRENVLARFSTNADGTIVSASEVVLLRVPSDREVNHEGGALEFAPDGTIFVSTGDNTIPFESSGYAPLDERPGREAFDSQRTSGNPFDLRGKILRINPDGTIPSGNLFAPSGEEGRPEIYVMGTRNPFRIAVNPDTGRLYWGDVGPDARADGPQGPRGFDEVNVADAPGDYGWPFCIGDNQPYSDVDFETGMVGAPFLCDGKVPAAIHYDYDSRSYTELGIAQTFLQGRTAIAGAYYSTQPASASEALPGYLQDRLIVTEWTRDLLVGARFTAAGELESLRGVLPWERFIRPIDVEVGPDGELFVLEFGSAFFGDNDDARVSRIQYSETGELRPAAVLDASSISGPTPLTVSFSGRDSVAPGRIARIQSYEWDVDGDGTVDSTEASFEHVYTAPGVFEAILTVIDSEGRRSFPFVRKINAGNTPPVLQIENSSGGAFPNGTTVPSGTTLELQVEASDAEDDEILCEDITWDRRLGHDGHTHPESTATGCTFSFDTTLPDHGNLDAALFWAIEVTYTDKGGAGGEAPLTGRAGVRINVE
ncbi:MAG: ThuA domain-containing protein [Deltaproteobacteria bacterium]|nr:ThuA domain-containing protein [Deltaproteobacteria bacterium]